MVFPELKQIMVLFVLKIFKITFKVQCMIRFKNNVVQTIKIL